MLKTLNSLIQREKYISDKLCTLEASSTSQTSKTPKEQIA